MVGSQKEEALKFINKQKTSRPIQALLFSPAEFLNLEKKDNKITIKNIKIKEDKITLDDVKEYLDNKILRNINENLSIRKGKFGDYIYYKTAKMKKPQFYKFNKF